MSVPADRKKLFDQLMEEDPLGLRPKTGELASTQADPLDEPLLVEDTRSDDIEEFVSDAHAPGKAKTPKDRGSSRMPLFAGIAAATVIGGGAAAYFLVLKPSGSEVTSTPDASAVNSVTATTPAPVAAPMPTSASTSVTATELSTAPASATAATAAASAALGSLAIPAVTGAPTPAAAQPSPPPAKPAPAIAPTPPVPAPAPPPKPTAPEPKNTILVLGPIVQAATIDAVSEMLTKENVGFSSSPTTQPTFTYRVVSADRVPESTAASMIEALKGQGFGDMRMEHSVAGVQIVLLDTDKRSTAEKIAKEASDAGLTVKINNISTGFELADLLTTDPIEPSRASALLSAIKKATKVQGATQKAP